MIYFTADGHVNHKRILEYTKRPFPTIEKMDAAIIERWNAVVGYNDDVYYLGDVTLGGIDVARAFFNKVNGNIKVIPGGHDHRWLADWHDTDRVKVLPPLYTLEIDIGKERPQVIVLCHYSLRIWDRSHYGSFHLYGHSHGTLPQWGKSLDVGVDCFDFTPISLEQVIESMSVLPDNVNLVK